MKLPKNLGLVLLALYLILSGLATFFSIGQLAPFLAVLAIAAGLLLLLSR